MLRFPPLLRIPNKTPLRLRARLAEPPDPALPWPRLAQVVTLHQQL